MTTFEWITILGAVCGLIMVVGSMGLLYKGIVKLNEASQNEAISVEFRKTIRIVSHYPALALFIIGLIFVGGAAHFAEPAVVKPLTLNGNIKGANPGSVRIHISAGPWSTQPTSEGKVEEIIYPNLGLLTVEVMAPGCNPLSRKIELKSGMVSLGEMVLNKVVDQPEIDSNNIIAANVALPPRSAQGSF